MGVDRRCSCLYAWSFILKPCTIGGKGHCQVGQAGLHAISRLPYVHYFFQCLPEKHDGLGGMKFSRPYSLLKIFLSQIFVIFFPFFIFPASHTRIFGVYRFTALSNSVPHFQWEILVVIMRSGTTTSEIRRSGADCYFKSIFFLYWQRYSIWCQIRFKNWIICSFYCNN